MKIFLARQNGRTSILEELVNEGTPSREWGFTESVYGKHYHKGGGGVSLTSSILEYLNHIIIWTKI